jgi:hypothetical protein
MHLLQLRMSRFREQIFRWSGFWFPTFFRTSLIASVTTVKNQDGVHGATQYLMTRQLGPYFHNCHGRGDEHAGSCLLTGLSEENSDLSASTNYQY